MSTQAATGNIILGESTWRSRQRAHAQRVEPWIVPRLSRRRRGERHPVDDFLFDYYPWRPAQLARWHPGVGVTLTGDVAEASAWRGYVVTGSHAWADPRGDDVTAATLRLLLATRSRQASYGCFGRHEWAMVYGVSREETRHASWPLRLSPADIATVVESAPLRCTHFDAFRFYTEAARPLNVDQPTRATQVDLEQPGCLHATMDLYKWAFRSYPIVGADLTADCFELAREVRQVDMRASPYDLSDLGYAPIAIETPEGRAEYVAHQRDFAGRGADVRERLIMALQHGLPGTSA
jgi:hypothetical protein